MATLNEYQIYVRPLNYITDDAWRRLVELLNIKLAGKDERFEAVESPETGEPVIVLVTPGRPPLLNRREYILAFIDGAVAMAKAK